MAAQTEARTRSLKAQMAALLLAMRMGATMHQAAPKVGITRNAVRVWLDKARAGVEPYATFASDYAAEQRRASGAIKSGRRDGGGRQASEARGVVYFVAPERGCIKIGFTRHGVMRRLRQLQIGSPVPLRVLATVEAPIAVEQWLHLAFRPDRSHGEWFTPSERLLDYIEAARTVRVLARVEDAALLLTIRDSARRAA
jgi:hypothetical protein